jgi:hypothetical protein
MTRFPQRVAFLTALGALAVPAGAWAWSLGWDFDTSVHGHEFSRVSLESSGCDVKVQLLFAAPTDGYASESPARNVYRFHARIKLDGGHSLATRVFNNREPGARAYSYVQSTQAEGCWAKGARKLQGIDVEGCRGVGCKPAPLP